MDNAEEERVPDRKLLVCAERLPTHIKERICYTMEEARNKKDKTQEREQSE